MLWLNKLRIQAKIEEVNVNLVEAMPQKEILTSWVEWHIPLIPARGGQRQVDLYEFKAILVYKSANGCLLKSCSLPVKGGRQKLGSFFFKIKPRPRPLLRHSS